MTKIYAYKKKNLVKKLKTRDKAKQTNRSMKRFKKRQRNKRNPNNP